MLFVITKHNVTCDLPKPQYFYSTETVKPQHKLPVDPKYGEAVQGDKCTCPRHLPLAHATSM